MFSSSKKHENQLATTKTFFQRVKIQIKLKKCREGTLTEIICLLWIVTRKKGCENSQILVEFGGKLKT